MQFATKQLECAVKKIIKNELKYNKINELDEIAVIKYFGYRRSSVFVIT